jgi:hypothetical protein
VPVQWLRACLGSAKTWVLFPKMQNNNNKNQKQMQNNSHNNFLLNIKAYKCQPILHTKMEKIMKISLRVRNVTIIPTTG